MDGSVTVTGSVSYLVHVAPDSGFCVFRMRLDEGGQQAVVGMTPKLREGDRVRVTGKRQMTEKFGSQIRADTVVLVEDLTDEGVAQSIARLAVPGVGIATARKIVTYFGGAQMAIEGMRAAEALRLELLPHGTVAADLETAWNASRASHECDALLASLGLPPGLRSRVFERYGSQAAQIVKDDPYRLALEVTGIGFKTADELALKLGLDERDPKRIRAAAYYALQDSADKDGHIYSSPSLISRFAQSVGVPATEESVLEQLVALEEQDFVVVGPGGGAALETLFHAEESICSRIQQRDNDFILIPSFDVVGRGLSEEQDRACKSVLNSQISILTGGPGCGKSTCLKALSDVLDHLRISYVLCAPTGRAARRMTESSGRPAQTIHRLLGYGQGGSSGATFNEDSQLPYDCLLIDESSMIDSVLMSTLFSALRRDCQIILVGDADQLPPVGPGAPFRDLIASGAVPVARLTEIHRQAAGSAIVQSAYSVKNGGPLVTSPKGDRSSGSLHFFPTTNDAEAASTIVRGVVDSIPSTFGFEPKDIQVIVPTRKGVCSVTALNAALQEALNPVQPYVTFGEIKFGDKVFRAGDRVTQLKNDSARNVVNGDIGYVTMAWSDGLSVRMEDGREVSYSRGNLKDLDLAYATTIHRQQGSQHKVIVLGLMKSHFPMLTRTILYTAITRAQELCVIVGDPYAVRKAIANVTADERRTLLPLMLSQTPRWSHRSVDHPSRSTSAHASR